MMVVQLITNLVLLCISFLFVTPQIRALPQTYTIAFGFAAPTEDALPCTETEMIILDDIAGVALAASGYADLAASDGWERITAEEAVPRGSSRTQPHEGHRKLNDDCDYYCWELCELYSLFQYCACCTCCSGRRRRLQTSAQELPIALTEIKTQFDILAERAKQQISCVDPSAVRIVAES